MKLKKTLIATMFASTLFFGSNAQASACSQELANLNAILGMYGFSQLVINSGGIPPNPLTQVIRKLSAEAIGEINNAYNAALFACETEVIGDV